MDFEIIDFHTHPFFEDRQNICPHREYCGMSAEGTRRTMEGLGISKICGSVIRDFRSGIPTTWQALRQANCSAPTIPYAARRRMWAGWRRTICLLPPKNA